MNARWEIERAIRESGLPHPARLVVLALLTRADAGTAVVPEKFSPSLSALAAETGLHRATVARHLVILEKAGWITRHRSRRAAKGKVPNWYEVHVPTSRRARLVAERDQKASRRARPELVAQRDQASRTVRPIQNSSRPKPQHSGAVAPATAEPTAQNILGAFLDWDRANGRDPLTRRTVGQLARHIGDMLAEEIDAGRIRRGLAAWRERGQHPSTLHSFVDAAMVAPARPAMTGPQATNAGMFDRAERRAAERDAARDRGELP